MSEDHTIGEAALHAFVDNELDVEASREVETWLRQHPEQLHTVNLWKDQKDQLKAAFDPVLEETLPKSIQEILNRSGRPKKSLVIPWRSMAAGIALLMVGMGSGWYLSKPQSGKGWPVFAQNAISSHLVFASDLTRPIEVAAPQQDYFLAWVKHIMGKKLTPPTLNFAGFKFLGGRVLPHEDRPAVMFMYEDVNGKRITLLVGQNRRSEEKPMRLWSKSGLNCYFWFNGPMAFSVTSDIEAGKLKLVSEKVRDHFTEI